MVLSRKWTGFEAAALQDATRMSVREFAEHLDVNARTVMNWRKGGSSVAPRPFTQGLLDTALRRLDSQARERFENLVSFVAVATFSGAEEDEGCPRSLANQEEDAELRAWVELNRRTLLRLFGGIASGLPAVAAILAGLDIDERQRFEQVLITPSRVDGQAIDHIETALGVHLAQNDVYGPNVVLPMVAGQKALAEALLPGCPDPVKERLFGLHGALSQVLGWMHFDLHDFGAAAASYEDARTSAHRGHNSDLAALVLCNMAFLATWQGEPRIAIDHAVAAQNWARRSNDYRLSAYADDMAAMAYAKDRQRTDCYTALGAADVAVALAVDQPATGSVAYFQGPGLVAAIRSDCMHQLGDGREAKNAAEEALRLIGPEYMRNRALAHLDLANAHTDLGEIDAAVHAIDDSAKLALECRSDRLAERIVTARTALASWNDTVCVRELDQGLDAYGFRVRT